MRMAKFGDLDARVLGGTDGQGGGDGPVVVLLHGFGAPGYDLVGLHSELAAPAGTRFVFPEAPLALDEMGMMDARAWWLIDMARIEEAMATGRIRDMSGEVPEGLAEANAKLGTALDAVQAELGGPEGGLVLGGFSQGAMLSLDYALRSERPLAGLLLFSGTFLAAHEWTPLMAKRAGLTIVQSHGAQDPLLPYVVSERLKGALTEAGWDVRWVPFMGQHQIPRDALVTASQVLREVL